jgi:hypothetical protein
VCCGVDWNHLSQTVRPVAVLRNVLKYDYISCSVERLLGSQGEIFSINLDAGSVQKSGARGSVVGWGTMLQDGRSRIRFPMRSLDFQLT